MGLKRRLRKEYQVGYTEGLSDVPPRIKIFFGSGDELDMLRDAYVRGWREGQAERKHRKDGIL